MFSCESFFLYRFLAPSRTHLYPAQDTYMYVTIIAFGRLRFWLASYVSIGIAEGALGAIPLPQEYQIGRTPKTKFSPRTGTKRLLCSLVTFSGLLMHPKMHLLWRLCPEPRGGGSLQRSLRPSCWRGGPKNPFPSLGIRPRLLALLASGAPLQDSFILTLALATSVCIIVVSHVCCETFLDKKLAQICVEFLAQETY